jgi:RimJ/RimL family protein N-acetyltransferase
MNFRKPNIEDAYQFYIWANDPQVRLNSFNSENITLDMHMTWFRERLQDPNCELYVFYHKIESPIGQVRIQKDTDNNSVINISIDEKFRGMGYGVKLIEQSTNDYFFRNINDKINAYVKIENLSSIKIFEKSGYLNLGTLLYHQIKSYHFIKYANR